MPVVFERKIASYCFRFPAVMSLTSHDVVDVHAPVFLPISSIIRAASGIDECWKPAEGSRDQISTLRGFCGVAGGLSGRRPTVAIILVTSFGQASRGFWLRPPHASFNPDPPRPAAGGACGATGAGCCARAGPNAAASETVATTLPSHLRIDRSVVTVP